MQTLFGYVDGRWMRIMLISLSEVVGSYLIERNSDCLTLFHLLVKCIAPER